MLNQAIDEFANRQVSLRVSKKRRSPEPPELSQAIGYAMNALNMNKKTTGKQTNSRPTIQDSSLAVSSWQRVLRDYEVRCACFVAKAKLPK